MPQFSATPRDRAIGWVSYLLLYRDTALGSESVGGRRAPAGRVLVDHGRHAPGLEVDPAAKPSLRASERGCERLAAADDSHAHAIGRGVHQLGHMLESQQRSVVRQKVPVCPRDHIAHRLCSAVLKQADMLNSGAGEKMLKSGRKELRFGPISAVEVC